MQQIKADVVILPVGGTYTMTAAEAAEAVNTIQPEVAIPMHYGSIIGSMRDAETFKRLTHVSVEILTPA
jgi:L-ascorbate metabolism protein UlaG (beta-lactamase superfamily)